MEKGIVRPLLLVLGYPHDAERQEKSPVGNR